MLKQQPDVADPTKLDREFVRELRQLCHPDRHDQSPLSVRVFQRLNEVSKLLDKTPETSDTAASTQTRRAP